MTNFEFLQKYMQLQNGIMFDHLFDLGFAVIGDCKKDSSPFWNFGLVNEILSLEQLLEIEKKLFALNRKPAVYFERRVGLEPFARFLGGNGYEKSNEDSWMFYDSRPVDEKYFDSVKRVSNNGGLQVFLKTFESCYQKNDPQNPYGELGDYLKVAKDVWRKNHNLRPLEYLVVYKGNEPVAVSALTSFEGIGYISNVGSLRKVRGDGYGKAATMFCLSESIKRGNTEHCLATEEGNYPNEFYKRIGFKTRFSAPLYTKTDEKTN
ncbi:MAG: GNAT family N-acetyltransferase [Candidatus Vogelbacteria bacterium]|nr:GNAT family N-acetyltransferase [Candidatus Vogelbacteria bacterium]